MDEHFGLLLDELNLTLSEKQINQFERYYNILIEWNNKLNLTSITEREDVYIKHFFDSLCLTKAFSPISQTLLDVGSGAGFPSIPLKIVYPDLKVTIIDALQKRITFLEHLINELDIQVELLHIRAEDYQRKNTFDIVTARAVANLQVLSELCIPFVKKGGHFLSMKGPQYEQELQQSTKTFIILGAEFERTIEYQIDEFSRTIIVAKKLHETDKKYPRNFGRIKAKPL